MSWKYEGRLYNFHLGLYLTICCADALFYLFLLNMRFGSFLAPVQRAFLPPAPVSAGTGSGTPRDLDWDKQHWAEKKWTEASSSKARNFKRRLIWMFFLKWKPGGWFRQARWALRSHQTPRLEAAERQPHLEGSWCGRVQITGGSTMDNTNYEDIGHLPHACHTQLKGQLCCSYTYMGSAGANLFLRGNPGEASCLHFNGKTNIIRPKKW